MFFISRRFTKKTRSVTKISSLQCFSIYNRKILYIDFFSIILKTSWNFVITLFGMVGDPQCLFGIIIEHHFNIFVRDI